MSLFVNAAGGAGFTHDNAADADIIKGEPSKEVFGKVGILAQRGGWASDRIPTFSNQNQNHTKG